jgi:hypothetical protein
MRIRIRLRFRIPNTGGNTLQWNVATSIIVYSYDLGSSGLSYTCYEYGVGEGEGQV